MKRHAPSTSYSNTPSADSTTKRPCFFDGASTSSQDSNKELNQHQPFDFTRSLQQKSKLENLQPLQVLCQKSILSNLRHFFTLKEEPFAVLPWNLIGDLVRFVQKQAPDVLTNPDLLPLFVTEQTSYMSADFHKCAGNTEAVQRLMVAKLAAFSPSLTKLDIRMKDYSSHSTTLVSTVRCLLIFLDNKLIYFSHQEDPIIMHKMVNSLISNLTNLEDLRLNCYVENNTLGLLGQTCPKLKFIDISGNKGVSNQGIFMLFPGTTSDAGRCSRIETLDVSNTGVGLMGGVHALASLPKLRVLKHNSTYSVLKAFRERHKTKSLPALEVLQITELPFRARFATSEHLKNVINC
jgi:hypothetical protein